MKNKFLIVSAVFPPEPVVSAKLSYDLATEISKDNAVTVVSPAPTRPYGFKLDLTPADYPFEHIQMNSYTCPESSFIGRLRETYSFGIHCYRYIKLNHKSITHIYSNTWPLFAQYLTVKAAYQHNIPVTIHVQDIYPESLSNKMPFGGWIIDLLLMPFDKYVFKRAARIIAISEKMKQYLSKSRKVNITKISVVANWQDENDFIAFSEAESIKDRHKFTFMYLGNIGPVAGVEGLIEAFIKANLQDAKLVIAGSGSMKETLVEQAAQHAGQNIEFWNVPDGKVPEIQSLADIMLLPMKAGAATSSIPSKLPAYMFSRKPVITSVDKNSDTATAVINSQCGFVVAPENVTELVDSMRNAFQTKTEELKIMGENGFKYAIENFSKKSNLEKLLKLFTIPKTGEN